MTTKNRRSAFDSTTGAADRLRNATTKFEPPFKLSADERVIFDRITQSRAAETWLPVDLNVAALCARSHTVAERASQQLCALPAMMATDHHGNERPHPLLSVYRTANNAIANYLKVLGLTAGARGLVSAQQSKRNQADKAARDVLERAASESEELL